MKGLEQVLHYIDVTNEKVGHGVAYLLIPLTLVTITEVVARYVFDKPTIWAWDTNLQVFGIVILLGAGFTLLRGRHVRIEMAMEHLPPKGRLVLDLLAMLVLMFVAFLLVWQGGIDGWESFLAKDKLNTIWAPYIFHIKMLYPIGGALLLFQGLAKFLRDLSALVKGGK